MAALTPPPHGGDLAAASKRYGIALHDWLDLSTGINPIAYPFRAPDVELFHHLPTDDEALVDAARDYAQAPEIPVLAAGSQVLIQWLPIVRAQRAGATRVAVPAIGYAEHAFRWRWAGHELYFYDPHEPASIDALLASGLIDVLVVLNAHNPLGLFIDPARLLAWHEQLAARGGWLIVDEAFVDVSPAHSVVAHTRHAGLIVLRSLGKFFGLAGVRCGFAFAAESLRDALQVAVGPWAVAGPSASIATQALRDAAWQTQMRARLPQISAANAALLREVFAAPLLAHALFNSVVLPPTQARMHEERLARQGIRVRRVAIDEDRALLRFGLVDPDREGDFARLRNALMS